MLQPKKIKYRKSQRGVLKGIATRGSEIAFGDYAVKTVEAGFLTSRQIEAARRSIIRFLKKWGKLWIRVFPDRPFTKHALEAPMGWGKGSPEMYRAPVKPGRILFEMSWVSPEVAREAFEWASYKLPVKTKILV